MFKKSKEKPSDIPKKEDPVTITEIVLTTEKYRFIKKVTGDKFEFSAQVKTINSLGECIYNDTTLDEPSYYLLYSSSKNRVEDTQIYQILKSISCNCGSGK
jgi:hypothetical protein